MSVEITPEISGNAAADTAGRLAVIDIGSNSVRLVVAQMLPGGDFRVLDDEREATRLAKSLVATRHISEDSMNKTLDALRRFQKIANGLQAGRLKMIATCAVREAENGAEFCRRAREETGVEIEVISPWQEAHFAFLSVRRAFDISDKNVALADIGGGSTEIVLASAGHVQEIYPTNLGAVRLTDVCGGRERLFDEELNYLEEEIDRQLEKRIGKPPFVAQLLIGTGGTFTSLASMLIATKGQEGHPEWGYRTSRAEVRHLLDRLAKMTVKQRRSVPGLNADRADIIVAGLCVIDRLMRYLKINVLQVHNGGVRDGLLLSMVEQLASPSTDDLASRTEAQERFAQSCGVDVVHSRHVSRLAGMIFDQLQEPFALDPTFRPLLESAAILQDVGYLINYDQHHKHSYHLILNSQLPGFQRHELELIANIARYHRGAKPKKKHQNFQRLSREEQQRVRQMVAILRLAGALDRSHSQEVVEVDVQVADGQTRMNITSTGDPEVNLWAARRRVGLFERVFDTDMIISAA